MRLLGTAILLGVLGGLGACGGEPASVEADVAAGPAGAIVQDCLDLVASERFSDALAICSAAAERLPDDQRVRDALEEAQAEAPDLGND